jgi:hypothetical protein
VPLSAALCLQLSHAGMTESKVTVGTTKFRVDCVLVEEWYVSVTLDMASERPLSGMPFVSLPHISRISCIETPNHLPPSLCMWVHQLLLRSIVISSRVSKRIIALKGLYLDFESL